MQKSWKPAGMEPRIYSVSVAMAKQEWYRAATYFLPARFPSLVLEWEENGKFFLGPIWQKGR